MTTDIYDQHRAAFSNVSAYVIAREGQRVATIAFKHPRDGAGRLYAYVQCFGEPMVRGFAGGYGYDKQSAACAKAGRIGFMQGCDKKGDPTKYDGWWCDFWHALRLDDGYYWYQNLEKAGFTVWQAV